MMKALVYNLAATASVATVSTKHVTPMTVACLDSCKFSMFSILAGSGLGPGLLCGWSRYGSQWHDVRSQV